MKNKMPLDGLGLGHDSGSVHCDMLKMLCFRTAWGGIGFAVTSSFSHKYANRAFRRCQSMAQAEGFVCLEVSINEKAVFRQ